MAQRNLEALTQYAKLSDPSASKRAFEEEKDKLGIVDAPTYQNAEKIAEFNVGTDPKQVQIYKNVAYVANMMTASLDVFDLDTLKQRSTIKLSGMPVEIAFDAKRDLCLVSEMGKGEGGENSVFGIDVNSQQVEFRIATGGEWSKFMALRPKTDELWVSNWKSDDFSIINIKDKKLVGKITRHDDEIDVKTPRGIAFTPNGKVAYACGYYSRDILKINATSRVIESRILLPIPEGGRYLGTPRHIIIDSDGQFAYVSNQGRGCIHKLDLRSDEIVGTISTGKFTSTIDFDKDKRRIFTANEQEFFTSVVDVAQFAVVGKIPTAGHAFGLDINEKGDMLCVVSFDTKKLEVFRLTNE